MTKQRGIHPRSGSREGERERQSRKEFIRLVSEFSPYVAVEKDGAAYVLPIRQKFGVGRFAWPEWKEHRHLDRALAHLQRLEVRLPGDSFVEVGANIGTTTIHALRHGPFRSAWAFEPEPTNYRLLRMNLAANDLDEVCHTFNVAVSDRSGTASLALRSEIGSKHHLVRHASANEDALSVSLVTLDDLVEAQRLDPKDVGLFWLDIEGHELEALRGSQALLDRSVPIVMEFDGRVVDRARCEEFADLLGPHYTGAIDLRAKPSRPEILRFSDLEQVAKRYPRTYTDLLVFR